MPRLEDIGNSLLSIINGKSKEESKKAAKGKKPVSRKEAIEKTTKEPVFETKTTSFDKAFESELIFETTEALKLGYDPHILTEKIVQFGLILTGIPMYDYQKDIAYRIIYSVIALEGETITAMLARQSGKSEAIAFTIDTLCVILPSLAPVFPEELGQFRDGVKIGLFAPQSDQMDTTYSRAMLRLGSDNAKMILSDPEINTELLFERKLSLSNGSSLTGQIISKQSKIESKTYHLVIIEEAQDADSFIIGKCYAFDTPINMPDGTVKSIQEVVETKSSVLTPEGEITPTDWIDTGVQKVFKVELSNGSFLAVTKNHRHKVFQRSRRRPTELQTHQLKVGDRLAVPDALPYFGNYGSFEQGVILGSFLGDGCLSGGSVQFIGTTEYVGYLAACVKAQFPTVKLGRRYIDKGNGMVTVSFRTDGTNTPNPLRDWFKDLGIVGCTGQDKFIPNLPYSEAFLKGLVVGLVETDGCVTAVHTEKTKKGYIRFANISENLVYELKRHLLKFGVHSSISMRDNNKYKGNLVSQKSFCKPLLELHIRDVKSVSRFYNTFRLVTKQSALNKAVDVNEAKVSRNISTKLKTWGYPAVERYYNIVSIEELPPTPTYCVTVPTKEHWIIANGIISGNSVEPMLTSTNGTLVKVGTTGVQKNDFYEEIQRNIKRNRTVKDPRLLYHFQADYKQIIKQKRAQYEIDKNRFHLNYERFIQKIIEKRGVESESFKLAYALIWQLETGMLLTDFEYAKLLNRKLGFTRVVEDSWDVRAGLDIAKDQASTVMTIARILPNEDSSLPPLKQILWWMQLDGLSYETQHNLILETLIDYNVSCIACDYTGVGRPVVDRLIAACGEYLHIIPYTFSRPSKSEMWQALRADIEAKRLIIPASQTVRDSAEYRNFETQLKGMVKYYDGGFLVSEASKETVFDDYGDSLGLMVVAGNTEVIPESEVEQSENPLFSGKALSEIIQNSW